MTFYDQSQPLLRDIRSRSYWAPRRLYARLLAGSIPPEDVSGQTVEILAANRRWVMAERIGDGERFRMKSLHFVREFSEIEL